MNQYTSALVNAIRRPAFFLAAVAMLFTVVTQVLPVQAGQVQNRAIRMSDNGASGGSIVSGVGSGTNVTYRVYFKAASNYTLKGVVIDFCNGSGTPFIGDATCVNPTGFNAGATPTIDVANYVVGASTTTGLDNAGAVTDWTAATATTPTSGQTPVLTSATGVALTSGTTYTFAISGITNPSTVGTFYARLTTYTSGTGLVAGYDHGTPMSYQDYGGFALSTAGVVQVTAKVQETLTFCVSGYSNAAFIANPVTAPGTAPTSCTDTTAPAIILGHGTNNTLEPTQVDTNDIWTIVSTNALHGISIRMHNSNACGGLSTDGGTTCDIPATNAGGAGPTLADIDAGTAAFGMLCIAGGGGSGDTVDCDANYNDGTVGPETPPITTSTAGHYGMDSTTVGDNVSSTYGDVVAESNAPVNARTNHYLFAATASNTTPAGIYKANLAMVATGTF